MSVLERLTASEARDELSKIHGKRSKYGVRQDAKGKRDRTVDGILFASKHEAWRYMDLKLLRRAGEIKNLELQVAYPLYAASPDGGIVGEVTSYIADFRYFDVRKNKLIVADAKGVETPEFKLKAKMMKVCHGINVVLV